jgi:hypothetical protein
MRDNVTAFEQRQNRADRRIILADMDHDRQRPSRFLRAAQRFEIVGACDAIRQARLDANDDVAIALDSPSRQRHIGRAEIVQFTGRGDNPGARVVDQAAAHLRCAPRNRGHRINIVRTACARIDPGRHAVLQAHRRPFLAAAGMGVNVDQARSHDLAPRIDGFGRVARNVGRDCDNPAARYRHVPRRVEAHRGIDNAPTFDDQVVGRRECIWNLSKQRSAGGANQLASVHHGRYPPWPDF